MIPAVCIRDDKRPNEIPPSLWVTKGETYRITHISIQVNEKEQGGFVLGCDLYELPIDKQKHYPFECFRLDRFAINIDQLAELEELFNDCINLPKDVGFNELIRQSGLNLV